jgi:hypothetical protein
MLKDHNRILQNFIDTLIARGLSAKTIEGYRWLIKRWFEQIRVWDGIGERQIFIWEVMNLVEGRKRLSKHVSALSSGRLLARITINGPKRLFLWRE